MARDAALACRRLDHDGHGNHDGPVGRASASASRRHQDRARENNMQVTMKDRVAVVTGGSKGIGFAVARRFAGAGAKVAILARGAEDLKAAREQLGKEGLSVRDYVCDVAKASDIAKAHEK